MLTRATFRFHLRGAVFFVLAACASGAQGLPQTSPTTSPAGSPQAAPGYRPAETASPATEVRQHPAATQNMRARIELSGGMLAITADNSSLNQILRDVARLNGMTITGGVTDEKVYGTYGPDAPAAVLSELLDGTGTNILVKEDAQHVVHELVLTPRRGGPSPPSPNAESAAQGEDADAPAQPGGRRGMPGNPQFQSEVPNQPQIGEQGVPVQAPRFVPQPASTDAPSLDGTTEQQSPNGVKTPQQIYEELLQRQQRPSTGPPPEPE